VIWGCDEIVAAADSKEVGSGAIGSNVCKIRPAKGAFLVMSGMSGADEVGYDPVPIALEACEEGTSMADKVTRFAALVTPRLLLAIEYVRANHPADYERYLGERIALGVTLFGNEGQQLAVSSWQLKASTGETRRADAVRSLDFVPILSAPGLTAENFMKKNSIGSVRAKPRVAAKSFVEAAIHDSPEEVGGPVHMLSVTRRNARWIEQTDACPDL
jgi:hypothetical protein